MASCRIMFGVKMKIAESDPKKHIILEYAAFIYACVCLPGISYIIRTKCPHEDCNKSDLTFLVINLK